MALTLLAFLLPIYAKQLGASALGIGGLFAVAHCLIVLFRPVIGWASDRLGRKGFFVAGMVCYAGAMGVFALAHSVTMLYLGPTAPRPGVCLDVDVSLYNDYGTRHAGTTR